jgi:hypothetical protein
MTDPIETTDLPYHAKAVEIMSRQCCRSCKAVGDTCECEAEGGIRIAYPISGVDLVSAIAAALEAERLEERERCKVFNADVIAMILAENPDTSPAYLAVQICERIENA